MMSYEETNIVSLSSFQEAADMNFNDWIASITIPLEEIATATNNFADENLIAQGSYASVYKGRLLQSGEWINIVVRRVLQPSELIVVNDLMMHQNLRHENIVSLFGVIDPNDQAFMVYKYEANTSLDKYLSDPTLTWMQRLHICVGVAHALSYLHFGLKDDYSVIHGNIKSSKILLDHNWEPKLHDFRCAIKGKRHRLYLTNKYNGTLQYMDPAYENTGGLTHKSDVFSFGVLLFEVLFGRTASPNEQDNWYFARLARLHYEEGTLDDMIHPDLRKQMDPQSFTVFSETAYYCLMEQRAQRPDINQIVGRLEKALDFQYKAERSIVATKATSSEHQKATLKVDYSLLSRHPPNERLPFLFSNPPMNQVNGTIISFSLQEFGKLQIPLEDVSSATSNFADENMFAQGGFGKLYKGRLLWADDMIDIVARRLDSMYGQGEMELWMEISMLSSLKHKNLASILGFCDENGEKIIIYEHASRKSLDQHLTDETLTWSQRLQICFGVAHALNYIHYDKDVIHCDISSSKILIDINWEAKVFGFGLSTKYPGNWGHQLLFSHYFETSDFRDQVYVKTSSVTPKYDVYSFGILLYEVLCGRKPMIGHNSAKEKLDEMIDPHLRKQMDSKLLNIYTRTAHNCLNQQHVYRPTMYQIVKELEGALDPQGEREELEPSISADEAASSNSLTEEDMERLEIDLNAIKAATNNFSKINRIGEGGFAEVYQANLEHLNIQSTLSVEAIREGELPKKHSTVAIKRIVNMESKQSKKDFFAEVGMLNSCKHQNIISLLGICYEYPEMILVCEFASKGSLADCLEKNKMINVTWAQRLQICLDIANGLNYLHSDKVGKARIIHRDVKSANVLLDEKWNAKVSDFGLSKFHPENQQASSIHTLHLAGTEMYVDPEYSATGTYKKASDIYSFGVVLFEIFSGKLAYHHFYYKGDDKGLATVARRRFKEKTLKELIDPNMLEEADENGFTVNKGPNQKSLDIFLNIAHSCLAETQRERPQMEVIIQELQNAIKFQGKTLVLLKFRLSDIKLATKSFADINCIGVGAYGMMYKADLSHLDNKRLSEREGENVALKRIFNREDQHGKQGFFEEIEMLASCKHPNIVALLGISSEDREMVLVYKDAFQGSLHDCFANTHKIANLTWVQRIQISLDIAHGLDYLLTSVKDKQKIMQFGMNCANILLDDNWRAKIACFWLSILPAIQEADTDNVYERKEELDPEYIKIGKLKKESNIYSFGVILFEILCGKLEYDEFFNAENEKGLPTVVRRHFDAGILIEIIDPQLKEQIDEKKPQPKKPRLHEEVHQDSFNAYSEIAYRCLAETQADRPSMEDILKKLQSALNFQMEHLRHLKINVMQKMEDLQHLKIRLIDIKLATNDFSDAYCIGSGGFSVVYKAQIDHFDDTNALAIEGKNKGEFPMRRSTVAVKRISGRVDQLGEQGFLVEVELLSNCKHPNIISLFGFCNEDSEVILIYEYASNRSLDEYLGNTDNVINFTWVQRLQICLDVAKGLKYLHTSTVNKPSIIHRDIKSANILLDGKWMAKISDFGLSRLHPDSQKHRTIITDTIAGTQVYMDPEYMKTGKLKKESDIYSFGVLLFEIMCGRLAYDVIYDEDGQDGLPSVARRCFNEGTLKEMVDPKLREGDELLNEGLDEDSFDTFSKIAYQCLSETQAGRPTIEVVIKELEKAIDFQENRNAKLQISLEDIKLATGNFSNYKCIGEGRYWKQYEGEMLHANEYTTIVAKRFHSKSDHQFLRELQVLFEHKHENIIGLVGYCNDMDEKIIVYEHASNRELNKHLHDAGLTWVKRLKICIDVSCGLSFLHADGVTKDIAMMHRDIKSASILVDEYWTAKISNLELSIQSWAREEIEDDTDNAYGSLAYMDPNYKQSGYLTEKSDIYSLGVVLVEMLCGRLAWAEGCEDHSQSLGPLAKRHYIENGKLDELVFEGIKDQIDRQSLTTFANIALQCLDDDGEKRPEASEVIMRLKQALEFQEDFDIWEPKLPRDYEEILRYSKFDDMLKTYHTKKKDIYHILCKGVLLRDREVCLSLGSNSEKNYLISAKKFSYENRWAFNWRHIPQSRFENVVEMSTISNLKIKIKIKTQFLSPRVNYGVHLVFKFCGPRKFSSNATYVNLTYKMGNEKFHAYFATWRDEEWMMIELCRFFNHEGDTHFEVLLDCFSRCYCGSGAVYIEGIEFRAIDNVSLQTDLDNMLQRTTENDGEPEKLFSLKEVDGNEQLMLSAKDVLYDSTNVKVFKKLQPSGESRFQELIELLPQQVFRIKCKIESQMLSPNTDYVCYLVFKLSEKCSGLHCPVKVRDVLHWKNKESGIVYFRSPKPWNLHDNIRIPKMREDGWMEVMVWIFNSNSELRNDGVPMNLKLITYEGTMSGLIVCGLEIRPM